MFKHLDQRFDAVASGKLEHLVVNTPRANEAGMDMESLEEHCLGANGEVREKSFGEDLGGSIRQT